MEGAGHHDWRYPSTLPTSSTSCFYIAREPQSGYGLKRRFSQTPTSLYQSSPGALYPALRRLLSRSLLSVKDEASAGHRTQRLYQVTEAGLAAHMEWLRQPVDQVHVGHDLGLHLMRFALMEGYLKRTQVMAYLSELAGALESFIASLEQYQATDGKSAGPHGYLAVEHGIAVHRASLDWTRGTIADRAAGHFERHAE